MERLARVTHVTFDKTGTLTHGTPQVAAVVSSCDGWDGEDLYKIAASAELRSEHPLGKAIVTSYQSQRSEEIPQPASFQMVPGRGVAAAVDGHRVVAGNAELLAGNCVKLTEQEEMQAKEYLERGCTVTYVAVDGRQAGFIALSDTPREEAWDTVQKIKAIGVAPILLTGDHESAAGYVAAQLGISEIYANCLPEDKLRHIEEYQKAGKYVCMIGDGINDAPALKRAYVGIAMGGIGSDIAVDAADIVLINDKIRELPHLLWLARRMMTTIKCNLTFSMTLNFAAIILAITGVLNPVVGALVHNAGSVLVIVNSALLLHWKK